MQPNANVGLREVLEESMRIRIFPYVVAVGIGFLVALAYVFGI